ncbi:UNVERIFIED_CONTAM: hypothetical protein K2H54_039334 [Gekko kuhli]
MEGWGSAVLGLGQLLAPSGEWQLQEEAASLLHWPSSRSLPPEEALLRVRKEVSEGAAEEKDDNNADEEGGRGQRLQRRRHK